MSTIDCAQIYNPCHLLKFYNFLLCDLLKCSSKTNYFEIQIFDYFMIFILRYIESCFYTFAHHPTRTYETIVVLM